MGAPSTMHYAAIVGSAMIALFAGCSGRIDFQGTIDPPAGAGGASGTRGPTTAGAAGNGVGQGGSNSGAGGANVWNPPACDREKVAFAPARIWQLTDEEYVNVIRDVLGIGLTGADAEIAAPAHVNGEYTNFSENGVITDAIALRYQTTAEKVAQQASAPGAMLTLVGSSSPTDAQVRAFIANKVARLVRRPVSDTQMSELMAIYRGGLPDGFSRAFALVLEAVLQWPSFVFRTELGPDGAAQGTSSFELTPVELASALSFALTDTVPDEALWSKALDGTLASPDVLVAEIDRLMTTDAARTRMSRYFSYWLWIERLPLREKDVSLFPEYTSTLHQALYDSGFAFLKDVVTTGTLSDLLTSNQVYVNAEISAAYGIAGGTGTDLAAVRTMLPERSGGILTQPALLAATNKRPGLVDVPHHGLFVLENLLDGADFVIPPAPPPFPDVPPMQGDERQLAEQRAAMAGCAACHAYSDPFGLLRLRYDAIGRYDPMRYVATDATVLPSSYFWTTSSVPLDASATIIAGVGADLEGPLADTAALARKLNQNGVRRRVAYAAGKNVARYILGWDSGSKDSCSLQQAKERLYESGSFLQFYRELFSSSGFRTRQPGP